MYHQRELTSNECNLKNCLSLCKQSMPILNEMLFEIKNTLSNRIESVEKITSTNLEKEQFLTNHF